MFEWHKKEKPFLGIAGMGGGVASKLVSGALPAASYEIGRSLLFNADDQSYLERSSFSGGNNKKWTVSFWFKNTLQASSTRKQIFCVETVATNVLSVVNVRTNDGALELYHYNGNNLDFQVLSRPLFRDPSAWYHFVIAYDTTISSPASDRVKMFANGIQIKDFQVATYPSLDFVAQWNTNGLPHHIGENDTRYLGGYLAEMHFLDGIAPGTTTRVVDDVTETILTDFGEYDAAGVWNPIEYTGSYGSTGFYLDFADNSSVAALGYDAAGSNDWDVYNIRLGGAQVVATSVSNATGGLPIYNTTDTYGTTQGSGLRSDPYASYLKWCIPAGNSSGLVLSDQNPSGRTSSLYNVTNDGNLAHSTSSPNFYGGSMRISSLYTGSFSTSVWDSIASGPFTVEYWVKLNSTSMDPGHGSTILSSRPNGSNSAGFFNTGFGGNDAGKAFLSFTISGAWTLRFDYSGANNTVAFPVGVWTHVAVTKDSNNVVRLFGNGQLIRSVVSSAGITLIDRGLLGGHDYGAYGSAQDFNIQDIRFYSTAKYTSSFAPPLPSADTYANNILSVQNDSLRDSPTNGNTADDTGLGGQVPGNYCTINPLAATGGATFSNGNLQAVTPTNNNGIHIATFGLTTGKWYWESVLQSGEVGAFGITDSNYSIVAGGDGLLGGQSGGYGYNNSGYKYNNSIGSPYGDSFTEGDIIGVAFDATAGNLYFYKNGVVQNSGTPAFTGLTAGPYFPAAADRNTGVSVTIVHNFGQRPFANQNVPSGYKALCTANLSTPTIVDGSKYMDVVTYEGTAQTKSVTMSKLSPDFVWIKGRSADSAHHLFDIVRGATKRLITNGTQDDTYNASDSLTSFDNNGFTLGADTSTGCVNNPSGTTYVAWTWKAGGEPTTDNVAGAGNVPTAGSVKIDGENMTTALAGSIPATRLSANTTSKFSIVSYTGNNAASGTIGHALGKKPELIIVKRTGTSGNDWGVYHSALGATKNIDLNNTGGNSTTSGTWNDTEPTIDVFTVGTFDMVNAADTYIAYCFAPVEGYSSIGSYISTGSNKFVYLGFRPKFLLAKKVVNSADSTYEGWIMFDSKRGSYNINNESLYANRSYIEGKRGQDGSIGSTFGVDFHSNGFAFKDNATEYNRADASQYIYYAVAENPFKTARAR